MKAGASTTSTSGNFHHDSRTSHPLRDKAEKNEEKIRFLAYYDQLTALPTACSSTIAQDGFSPLPGGTSGCAR